MLAFYREHQKSYETEATARWEHLLVRFDKHPSKAAAYQTIAQYGNQLIAGAPFGDLARQHSDDVLTASDGGVHNWTTKGSLVSTTLDDAIFGLPVGAPSRILEDEQGFHIVRVLERKDFHRTPFVETQAEIKKQIRENRGNEAQKKYLVKLREKTPVWTVFDPPAQPQIAAQPGAVTR
jgi:parvulin-like peptidyl-prolyl isomerase